MKTKTVEVTYYDAREVLPECGEMVMLLGLSGSYLASEGKWVSVYSLLPISLKAYPWWASIPELEDVEDE